MDWVGPSTTLSFEHGGVAVTKAFYNYDSPSGEANIVAALLASSRGIVAIIGFLFGFHAQVKPCLESGRERMRFPVMAKIALQTAGSMGGRAGSPKPVGG